MNLKRIICFVCLRKLRYLSLSLEIGNRPVFDIVKSPQQCKATLSVFAVIPLNGLQNLISRDSNIPVFLESYRFHSSFQE